MVTGIKTRVVTTTMIGLGMQLFYSGSVLAQDPAPQIPASSPFRTIEADKLDPKEGWKALPPALRNGSHSINDYAIPAGATHFKITGFVVDYLRVSTFEGASGDPKAKPAVQKAEGESDVAELPPGPPGEKKSETLKPVDKMVAASGPAKVGPVKNPAGTPVKVPEIAVVPPPAPGQMAPAQVPAAPAPVKVMTAQTQPTKWESYATGYSQFNSTGKPFVVLITSTDCSACQKLEAVLAQPEVAAKLGQYITSKVTIEDPGGDELKKSLWNLLTTSGKARQQDLATPTLIVFTKGAAMNFYFGATSNPEVLALLGGEVPNVTPAVVAVTPVVRPTPVPGTTPVRFRTRVDTEGMVQVYDCNRGWYRTRYSEIGEGPFIEWDVDRPIPQCYPE